MDWLQQLKQNAINQFYATQGAPAKQLMDQAQQGAGLVKSEDSKLQQFLQDAYRQYQASGGKDQFGIFVGNNAQALQAQFELWSKEQATLEGAKEAERAEADAKRAQEAKFQQGFSDMDAQIQGFIDRFSRPLFDKYGNPADQEVANYLAAGRNIGQAEANNRGIEGGLAVGNTARQAMDATNGLAQFRQGLAQQALGQRQNLFGMRNNRDLSLQQMAQGNNQFLQNLAERRYQFDTDLQHQNQMAQFQARQQQGSGIGSVLGGLAGLGAAFIPGLGLAAAPALFAAGTGIGGGIGGLAAGGPPQMGYGRSGGYRWGT